MEEVEDLARHLSGPVLDELQHVIVLKWTRRHERRVWDYCAICSYWGGYLPGHICFWLRTVSLGYLVANYLAWLTSSSWAPWSEEFGRRWILQGSLLLVNLCSVPVALAPNYPLIIFFRALGGLFSAGGSITLGIVADMYTADTQQYAVAFVVLSSVGGSIFGPIIGGFVESYMHWRWCMWFQLIVGIAVQLLHFFLVDETRTTVLITNHARALRQAGTQPDAYGPNDIKSWRQALAPKELVTLWIRPFKMFIFEPIVLVLSLLSGFSDALIFMGFQSFGLVYESWHFTPWQVGLTFVAIGLGYLVAYLSYIPAIRRNIRQREQRPDDEFANFEGRMWWLMFTAPCLPIGLFIFAWMTNPNFHWIGVVIGSAIIGIANYSVYMGTIDYMVSHCLSFMSLQLFPMTARITQV
jgi:MFS family permease